MPQKPNRKDMQPYIASGEHGGEYTDYHAGTPYSKGYKPNKKENGKKEDKLKPNGASVNLNEQDLRGEVGFQSKNRGNAYTSVADHIDSNSDYTAEQKDYLRKVASQGDNDCNIVINKAQKKKGVQYSTTRGVAHCSGMGTYVMYEKGSLSKEGMEAEQFETGGSVFYHENGHMVDFQNGNSLEGALSQDYISEKYGTSLHKMITSETKNARDLYMELSKKKNDMINEAKKDFLEKNQAIYTEVRDYLKKLQDEREDATSGIKSFDEYNEINKKYFQKEKDYHNTDIYKEYKKLRVTEAGLEQNAYAEFIREYGDVSDMLDSRGYSLGAGHGASYWKRHGTRGYEFFAEAFSETATGNGHLKDYFPKSYEIVQEIIRSLA